MSIPNHVEVVAAQKEIYKNLPLGPERSWKITNGTAWALRDIGAGIYHKSGGENYNGYSVDIVVFKSGELYDVLGKSETEDNPQWMQVVGDVTNWRAPIDPATLDPIPHSDVPHSDTPIPHSDVPAPSPTIEAKISQIADDVHTIRLLLEKVAGNFGIRL